VELIDALSETGLNHIQVASFVNPNRVPGWADADEVVEKYDRKPGIHYTALWLNTKGLQRAMTHGNRLDIEGSFSLTASEKFLARNQQSSMEDNIARAHETLKLYKEHGIPLKRAGIMAAFGCNFEGEIPHQRILDMIQQLLDICEEHGTQPEVFSLADTMAWATPKSIRELVGKVREKFPDMTLSLHLHDTRGMGIANA
jgi:hydroxymethylglutaryl-CoA lyase